MKRSERSDAEIQLSKQVVQTFLSALLIKVEGIDPELCKSLITEEFMKHNRSEA